MNIFSKNYYQKLHYSKAPKMGAFEFCLRFCEFFVSSFVNLKNLAYEKGFLKEEKVNAFVICVGNLTTGGVGKTPIVSTLANEYSKTKKTAIISRGYGAKISTKEPVVVKDFDEIKFENGLICGDEPYQLAKNSSKNTVIIICSNRKKSAQLAVEKYGCEIIIMDDGFSNRKLKKDKTILVLDSKMQFGNKHLLPFGPLREPIKEIKRINEVVFVDKGNENLENNLLELKEMFKNYPQKICSMEPDYIYNLETKAKVKNFNKAIAFCAIGSSEQFFNFAKKFYQLEDKISFDDHHKYTKNDILKLVKLAQEKGVTSFITTQKDETKLKEFVEYFNGYSFNVLKLKVTLKDI